jgi:hypothetical protein
MYSGVYKFLSIDSFGDLLLAQGVFRGHWAHAFKWIVPAVETAAATGALLLAVARSSWDRAAIVLGCVMASLCAYAAWLVVKPPPSPTGCGCGLRMHAIANWSAISRENGLSAMVLVLTATFAPRRARVSPPLATPSDQSLQSRELED